MKPESILLLLPGGYSLRSAGETHMFGAYVRFCNQDGKQLKRWSSHDFAQEPERVMAAFLSILMVPALLECYRHEKEFLLLVTSNQEGDDHVVWTLNEKYALCSGGERFGLGAYVCFRDKDVHDAEDGEIVYWDQREWKEQPEEILHDLLACLQNPAVLARFFVKKLNDLL